MAKTSFYSGSGATSNDVDAVDGLKTAAENAKTAAETAQAAAETAKSGADTAKSGADTSAANAATSATAAASSASAASTSATAAATSATAAAASASSVNNYTGGTGITVSGTTITNDSPDQTVALTAGSNVNVSGTYPNFTISATDTNTTYSVGDGGLTEKNFTTTLKNKLDAVEANATADQTPAEIRAAVEAASDSNVFTDADHSKLDGIAASANNYSLPTASGSTLGGIKIGSGLSIDGSGVVTASGGGGGSSSLTVSDEGSALPTAATTLNFVGNGVYASGSGATKTITVTDTNTTYSIGDGGLTEKNFTTALNTKLSGIEANATADQTASEIESIVNHDNLQGFVAAEHIDWTSDQGSTNIHSGNYTNTTYSVGDGGLTQNNFTNTLKSKLDGIEASATADQTAAEIRTLVEAATDSNVFTDADHSKLNAIEANATADQTASEIKTAYESNSDTNAFTDAEKTKLSGVATSANNYSHPNHTGEVISTGDGAMVISDNVVDEANLKVSNSPTNGYVLTAQSGNTGGLTWAAASGGSSGMPTTGGTFTGDVTFEGGTSGKDIVFDRSDNALEFTNDYVKAKFGSGSQMSIYYASAEGSNIRSIVGTTGYPLNLWGSDVRIKDPYGNTIFRSDGTSAELYEDGAKKLETTSSGIQTTGTLSVNGAYTLPTSDGSANYVLTTNGSGVANWAAASGGGGGADLYAANESSPSAQPSATGTNAVAIGDGAVATNTKSMALAKSRSSGIESFAAAIDSNSSSYGASGNNSIAIGVDSKATASYALAIGGPYGNASGIGAIAIGRGAATANNTIAIGTYGSYGTPWASAVGSISIGDGSSSASTDGVAFGSNATVPSSSDRAVAIGKSRASGADSLAAAVGNNTSSYGATGANSVSIGYQAKATGQYAYAGGSLSTASGYGSISIGIGPTASAHSSIALGGRGVWNAQATAQASIAIGDGARSAVKGKMAFAGYGMGNAGSQGAWYTLYSDTTDATAEAMTTTKSTASTDNQIVLENNTAMAFHGTIVARQQAADGTACAAWKVEGLIRREGSAGTTVLVNSATTVLDNTPNWGMALSADTTNGCLKIQATGAASTDIRWVATIHTSEVTYA